MKHGPIEGSKPRALAVLTGCSEMRGLARTGYWLSELTHFHAVLADAGLDLDVASPHGGRPPMDERSRDLKDRTNRRFLDDPALTVKMARTLALPVVDAEAYAAVYLVGGHGAMEDLRADAALGRLVARLYERGGVVAAVCHGCAGLLGSTLTDGTPFVRGRRVTGFANVEEALVGLRGRVPYSLEDELRRLGARYSKAPLPFFPHVVVDGRLATGQNPASARPLARAVVKLLTG